jgi:hypothetical protein
LVAPVVAVVVVVVVPVPELTVGEMETLPLLAQRELSTRAVVAVQHAKVLRQAVLAVPVL